VNGSGFSGLTSASNPKATSAAFFVFADVAQQKSPAGMPGFSRLMQVAPRFSA
jgi:hypothetical protein